MTAPENCGVCRREDREEIDQAIADGEPLRSIGGRFGFSSSTAFAHKANVSAEVMAAGAAALVADGLLGKLTRLEADAHRIKRKAMAQGDYKSAISAVGQLVRLVEVAARIVGAIGGGPASTGAAPTNYVLVFEGGMPKPIPSPPAIDVEQKKLEE